MVVNQNVWQWWGMAREDLHFRLRLPEELKAKIEQAASQSQRSMTAEIVARLDSSFAAEGLDDQTVKSLVAKYWASVDKENQALREAALISERIALELARAVQRAADGNPSDLNRLVEKAKTEPAMKKIITVFSILRED